MKKYTTNRPSLAEYLGRKTCADGALEIGRHFVGVFEHVQQSVGHVVLLVVRQIGHDERVDGAAGRELDFSFLSLAKIYLLSWKLLLFCNFSDEVYLFCRNYILKIDISFAVNCINRFFKKFFSRTNPFSSKSDRRSSPLPSSTKQLWTNIWKMSATSAFLFSLNGLEKLEHFFPDFENFEFENSKNLESSFFGISRFLILDL